MNAAIIDSLSLWCGCTADVRRDPATGQTLSRTVASEGNRCPNPEHRRGACVWLLDLLPYY